MIKTESGRVWEIDLLRGLAIILMVIYHIVYDLNFYVGINVDYANGFWYWVGKSSALLFIFISGISSGFSKHTVVRGLRVFGFAMVITLATYIFYRSQTIQFGILHFLAICMIIFPLLKRMSKFLLLGSAILIGIAAIPLNSMVVKTGLLLPFGVMYSGFSSFDYYPLSPYLAVFMLGVLVYKLYYYKKQSLFHFTYENKFISMISQNSLVIYLVHQPIIIGLIYLFKLISQ